MKGLLSTIAGKLAGVWKVVFVAHAKVCIIAGSVVVAGSAAAVTTATYVHHNNSRIQVQAHETEVETESNSNLDKLNKILSETQTESQTETEAATQEEIAELVMEAVADENTSDKELYEIINKAAENSSAPIPVKDVEDLEIVEDNSSEPSRDDADVEEPEPEGPSSDEIYEVSQLMYGIDVSRWQGDIDWSAVADDGITFAMIKCGGGDDGLYEDRKFRQNIQGALANGIQVGVYFYSGATNARDAYDEASYCISLLSDYQITYPVAFDWELDGDYDSVTEACETFCNVIASYGYQPMVYSNKYRWYDNFDGEKIASKYKVWMACFWKDYYYTSTRWAYGDGLADFRWNYDMWQYGVTDTVAGIDGYVDMNIAFFGYANYHVDTKDAVLTVTNKEIKRTYGEGIGRLTEELNLLDGVKGTNTIGYDMDVEYSVYDESGNEYSEEEAISTAGKYTVEYRFKDPKSGWIKNTATLEIEVISEEFTGSDIVVKNNSLSKDYNFRTGVSCKNNRGQAAELTGVVIKKVNIETEEEEELTEQQAREEKYDFEQYSYVVEYTFDVPGEGEVIKKAAIVSGSEE